MSSTSSGSLNPNAQTFSPSISSSPSQWKSPDVQVLTPSPPPLFHPQDLSIQQQRDGYRSRIRIFNAGIDFIDKYHIPNERARIQQAQAGIALLQAEYEELNREFLENYAENRGSRSLYEAEDAKRMWGWEIRKLQIEDLESWIRGYPEVRLRHLHDARESYFEDLFPRLGEMGPVE